MSSLVLVSKDLLIISVFEAIMEPHQGSLPAASVGRASISLLVNFKMNNGYFSYFDRCSQPAKYFLFFVRRKKDLFQKRRLVAYLKANVGYLIHSLFLTDTFSFILHEAVLAGAIVRSLGVDAIGVVPATVFSHAAFIDVLAKVVRQGAVLFITRQTMAHLGYIVHKYAIGLCASTRATLSWKKTATKYGGCEFSEVLQKLSFFIFLIGFLFFPLFQTLQNFSINCIIPYKLPLWIQSFVKNSRFSATLISCFLLISV